MGMQLDLDYNVDAQLLGEFASWVSVRGEIDSQANVGDADVFIFWRRTHSTGILDAFDEDDIVAFLLEWCPRKYAADPEALCASVAALLEFLGDTERLEGGRQRAEALSTLASRLTPSVRAAMANPDDRGMTRMLFHHPMVNPSGKPRYAELIAQGLSEKKLNAELERRISAWQALPSEEREALVGAAFDDEPDPVEVPFDLADAPASALIDALDWVPDEQRQTLVDAWQPGADLSDRVGQLVDLIASADDAGMRLKGFAVLELFQSDVVGPAVRPLLDGPAAGHAALYLLSRGLADEAEVGGFINVGLYVEVLASSLDDPGEMCEAFSEAPQQGDQYVALEQMVRHPARETQLVLDTLGQHLTDKNLAKAARKAAVRHRSWMANRT